MRNPIINLKGQKFNLLTAVEYRGNGYWLFKCDCGNFKTLKSGNVKNNNTKSCGCLLYKSKNIKHNMSNTRTYRIWENMKTRCNNPNSNRYEYYGEKGISVCKEWELSFISFLNDMQECPSANHTIERLDGNKGYYKKNCKWATYEEQNNNKSNTIKVVYNNEVYSLKQLCKFLNLNYKLTHQKFRRDKIDISIIIPNTKLL